MEIPKNVEPMHSVVDTVTDWIDIDARHKYITIAKILRGKGFTMNEVECILGTLYYAARQEIKEGI